MQCYNQYVVSINCKLIACEVWLCTEWLLDIAFNLIITCCRKAADNAEEVEEVEEEEGELWLHKEGMQEVRIVVICIP